MTAWRRRHRKTTVTGALSAVAATSCASASVMASITVRGLPPDGAAAPAGTATTASRANTPGQHVLRGLRGAAKIFGARGLFRGNRGRNGPASQSGEIDDAFHVLPGRPEWARAR